MATEVEVNKNNLENLNIVKAEIEYGDMNYIIVNLKEKVIDVDGNIYEYSINEDDNKKIRDMLWEYKDLDEFDYWPDKTRDHELMSTMWRVSFYDEFENYYHKSGATMMPPKLNELINILKKLK